MQRLRWTPGNSLLPFLTPACQKISSRFTPCLLCRQVYCAHEYTLSNAKFAAHVDPGNGVLAERKREVERLRSLVRCHLNLQRPTHSLPPKYPAGEGIPARRELDDQLSNPGNNPEIQPCPQDMPTVPSTLGEELDTNPFLRPQDPAIRATLGACPRVLSTQGYPLGGVGFWGGFCHAAGGKYHTCVARCIFVCVCETRCKDGWVSVLSSPPCTPLGNGGSALLALLCTHRVATLVFIQ